MLTTLKKIDQQQALDLLSSTTVSLLPDPGVGPPTSTTDAEIEMQERLLEEVRDRLGVQADDWSYEAKGKFLKFLAEEMRKYALSQTSIDTVRARLGQRGDLRPDLYQVEFHKSFYKFSELGTRRSHVEEALRRPDDIEHLLPDIITEGDRPAISLYLKRHGKSDSPNRFTLLVQAWRQNDVQLVFEAWRIYHSDVDLSGAQTVLEALRSFIEVFGIPFRVGGSDPKKFFIYETVPFPTDQQEVSSVEVETTTELSPEGYKFRVKETEAVTLDNALLDNIFSTFMYRLNRTQSMTEIAIAYTIDTRQYWKCLQSHGVKISR